VEWGRPERGGLLERYIGVTPFFTTLGNKGELVAAVGAGRPREGCGFQLAAAGPPRPRRSKGDSLIGVPWWFMHLQGTERSPTSGRSA
jgi:hypothetical protein